MSKSNPTNNRHILVISRLQNESVLVQKIVAFMSPQEWPPFFGGGLHWGESFFHILVVSTLN